MSTRKTQPKKNNKGKSNRSKLAGPTRAPAAVNRANGLRPRAIQHELLDAMGKKPGMHTASGRRACEQWLDPMSTGVPVVNSRPISILDAGNLLFQPPVPYTSGTMYTTRHTVDLVVGTGGVGYFISVPAYAGCSNAKDAVVTDATFTQTTVQGAGTGVNRIASCAQITTFSDATVYTVLGSKFRLTVNTENVNARNGKCIVWDGDDTVGGLALASVTNSHFASTYGTGIFDDEDELTVSPAPPRNSIVSRTASTFNIFTATWYEAASGFIVKGNPGDLYVVEVEMCVFVSGSSVPKSITPIIDNAALDCLETCIAEQRATQVGYTRREKGGVRRNALHNAENHTIMSTAKPIISSLWEVIKKTALSQAPQLLGRILA